MEIQEFFKKFPDEASCKTHFKEERDKQGGCLQKIPMSKNIIGFPLESNINVNNVTLGQLCGAVLYYMVRTQLPYHYWCFGMMMLTSTKKNFSALEVQRQLGHLYYEPIWYMLHKIRFAMR